MKRLVSPAIAAVALAGCAHPALPQFRAALARHDSATEALGEWCDARGIADPATIRAVPVLGDEVAADAALRAELGVDEQELLGFRHVRLMCGDAVLSDARNWYVPARLAPGMNAALAATQAPFGKVAAPLHFTRERLAEAEGPLPGCPADTVLTHRALLRLPDGRPLAWVQECYARAVLGR